MTERLLTIHAVLQQIGMSKSKVYQLVRMGRLPAPRMIAHKSLWLETEIQEWIAEQISTAPLVGTLAGRRAAELEKAA